MKLFILKFLLIICTGVSGPAAFSIVYSVFSPLLNGWSDPVAVDQTSQPDDAPAVVAFNDKFVAVFIRIFDDNVPNALKTEGTVDGKAVARGMEIVASSYDVAAGSWSAISRITNDDLSGILNLVDLMNTYFICNI